MEDVRDLLIITGAVFGGGYLIYKGIVSLQDIPIPISEIGLNMRWFERKFCCPQSTLCYP